MGICVNLSLKPINMSKFRGIYYCKLDSKGRILFPSKLRKQISSEEKAVFIGKMNTLGDALIIYTEKRWKRLESLTLKKLNPYRAKDIKFKRDFYKDIIDLELDGSGRIPLTRIFLEKLGIESGKGAEVVLVGQGFDIELMSKEKYEGSDLGVEERIEIAEDVMDGFEWGDEE